MALRLCLIFLLLTGAALQAACGGARESEWIRGEVRDATGAVPGAVVRVQTSACATKTGADGSFVLDVSGMPPGPLPLTAWATGYFCAGPVEASRGATGVVIELAAHTVADHTDYEWSPSVKDPDEPGEPGCSRCHGDAQGDYAFSLPVDEWLADAHGQSTTNPRFRSMYLGTDVDGNRSPPTRYVDQADYGRVPLPPDPSLPYFGPGYKLDFPDTQGNCAACHAPAAAIDNPYGVDPTALTGVAAEGVSCDFCHKVWDVALDEATGMPFENRPGVISYRFRRPPAGEQFFAGPFDDVAPGEDTYLPLLNESRFCAGCHFGVFWGVEIYNSFGEWRASPFSDPVLGRTCQDCHMPRLGGSYFVRPDEGGLERDPTRIYSHRMPGAADEALLQNALSMKATARREADRIVVRVEILNDKTGHHVPTGSPLRHLILLVRARDANGAVLAHLDGPTLPPWAGVGDPADGDYAGLPGKAFAKVLEELWTEVAPTGAYWMPTRLISDNRIAAFARDESSHVFAAPPLAATVEVRLLFRRAYIDLARLKGWDLRDIPMAEVVLPVP